jgi:hypothetical protein
MAFGRYGRVSLEDCLIEGEEGGREEGGWPLAGRRVQRVSGCICERFQNSAIPKLGNSRKEMAIYVKHAQEILRDLTSVRGGKKRMSLTREGMGKRPEEVTGWPRK